jgi:hypothetical protein
MKNHPILPLLLAVATVSAAPATLPSELKYDRLAVEYSAGGDVRSYGVSAQALLGGRFLVGAVVGENKFKDLGTTAGRDTSAVLGYKFALPQGDLVASLGYGQVQASGLSGTKAIALQGDATTLGLAWRQRLNESYEYSVGCAYAGNRQTIRSTSGATVTTASASDHDTLVSLELRYNVSSNVDVTLGYTFASGGNIWSLSTGYNF